MRKALIALLALTSALFALPATAGATGSSTTAKVWVTHGLPLDNKGTKVDVYVDNKLAIDDFLFGKTVGPLSLPAKTYDVQIRTPDGKTTLIQKSVAVPAKGSFSLVASFIDAKGTPGINVFANDTSWTQRGFARIALHHAAAAPAVDIDAGLFPISRKLPWLKGEIVSDAPNGAQANFVLPTWLRYIVDVRVAGTDTVVLPVDDVAVRRGVLTNVYVVGSAAGRTLQPLVVTIPNGS